MENSLQVIEQKDIDFYGDTVSAVRVDNGTVYVPVRPICDLLGVDWGSQRKRINRDDVLSDEIMSVVITTTDIDPKSKKPRTSKMLALPLDYLNGWLFGINASRVKKELKEKILDYKRECYRVLYESFQASSVQTSSSSLAQIRSLGLAIASMAEQQMEMEGRIVVNEDRLNKASLVVQSIDRRMREVEDKLSPSAYVTDAQASDISVAIKALATALTEADNSKNHYQSVFTENLR